MDDWFSFDPLDYLRTLWHMLPMLVLSLLVGGLGGLAYERIMADHLYAATTKFYVISGDWASEGRADDYVQIIASQPVIRTVITRMKMKDGAGVPLSEEDLLNMVEVSAYDETHVVGITVYNQDPFVASDVANLIRDVGMEAIEEIMEPGTIKIVERANIPLNIAKPKALMFIIVGGAAMFVGMLAIVFLRMVALHDKSGKARKMRRWPYIGFFALVGIIAGIGLAVHENNADRVGPEITYPEDQVTYEEGNDYTVLLNGVKAEDAVDGDCTAMVRVDDIYVSESGDYCIVHYVAKDKSNNVSSAERHAAYKGRDTDLTTDEVPSEA